MRLYVRGNEGKVLFSVWPVSSTEKQVLSPRQAEQLADVLNYHARVARGEKLPFKYHVFDTHGTKENEPWGIPAEEDKPQWESEASVWHCMTGSIFATSAHRLHNAKPSDLNRWVKIVNGEYVFCGVEEREGKFLGWTTVGGHKCAIIDAAVGIV